MPRLKNPDPNGYIMGQAKGRAENEAEGNKSVAQLLAEQKSLPEPKKEKEEKEKVYTRCYKATWCIYS